MLVESHTEIARLELPKLGTDDAVRAQSERACDELLALLKLHHPEYDPTPPKPEPVIEVAEPAPIEPEEPPVPVVPRIRDIQVAVCWYFNVPLFDMLSQRRTKRVNYSRQIAMWLAKEMTMQSLPQIGRAFAGRDHTTILHGVRKIEDERTTNEHVRVLLAYLMGVIKPA